MTTMPSMQLRIFLALAVTFIVAWGATIGAIYWKMSGREHGKWDLLLRNAAEQILQSLPDGVDGSERTARLRVAGDREVDPGKMAGLYFQAWIIGRRQNILASQNSPSDPMAGTFTPGYSDVFLDGQAMRVYAVSDATGQVQVQVGQLVSMRDAEFALWLRSSLVGLVALVGFLSLVMWAVVRWSLRPTRDAREAMERRSDGNLSPIETQAMPQEIRPLVDAFNGLLERVRIGMERERQFLGDAAHELRTPLAALMAHAEVAQHATSKPEADAAIAKLVSGIERTARLAQQLLDSARIDSERSTLQSAPVDLFMVASMVIEEFEARAAAKDIALSSSLDHAVVKGDLDDLGILVRNIVDNSIRYTPRGGRIHLEIDRDPDLVIATLWIRDDGPGVPEDERARLFERFFRGSTGNGERGSGIGLSLVHTIATAHGGTAEITAGLDGRGLGVRIVLPLARI